MVTKLIFASILLALSTAQETYPNGMSYDEVVEWSDEIWIDVEAGNLSPQEAMDMFESEVGQSIFDFATEPGEVETAQEEGVLPEDENQASFIQQEETYPNGMSYDEVVEWSDEIWIDVEAGNLSPQEAMDMFESEVGQSIFDFATEPGEVETAQEEGVLPEDENQASFVQKRLFKINW